MISDRSHDVLMPVLLALAVALLFIGAPMNGAFDWSDSPRHALNGVFIKDLFVAMPLHDPSGFAYAYYAKYPALTILFYPPLFYLLSAPFYALFGVSQETALLVVGLHYLMFAWGIWRLFRFWLPSYQALTATVMLAAAPEVAFWGRQVMLEIPAYAFMIWSAVQFIRYRRGEGNSCLYWSIVLLGLAMYTKISTGFLALAYCVTLLAEQRGAMLRQRQHWIALVLMLVGLTPLALLTLKFGQANVQSVSGIADAAVSRHSIQGWLWYARQIPGQLGWPVALLALAGLLLCATQRLQDRMSSGDRMFWFTWLACGYVFFSAIDLKEARHSIFILAPLVLLAVLALRALLSERWLASACTILAVAVILQTILGRPVQYVGGYAASADYIAHHAPRNSSVLFSGYRDGSFVFNMRARDDRPDLSVVRADKLLLSVAVRRELGVKEKELSERDLANRINELGIHYVVAQPHFWTDLEAMRRFERVLASPQFKIVARIPTPSNYDAHEKELVIYQNLGKVGSGHTQLELDLPIIGRSLKIQK